MTKPVKADQAHKNRPSHIWREGDTDTTYMQRLVIMFAAHMLCCTKNYEEIKKN